MWCVRVRDDGSFRTAIEHRSEPDEAARAAFSMTHWRMIDPEAAQQFDHRYTAEEIERRQLDFIAASGLSLRDKLKASITDARNRYGGIHVTTTHPTRP